MDDNVMRDKLNELISNGELKLISTHKQLCFPIIKRIAKKMSIGITFASINVNGDVIINGHHRYLASLLVDYNLDQTPCPITLAKEQIDWKFVKLVDEDWETEAGIKMWNEEDAKYNGLTLEQLLEKLK